MSYSLSLRKLAELLDDPDACGENLDPWEAGSSRLEIAVVEALPSILTLIDDLGETLEKIQRAKMAHHSGGDSAMIFDSYDGEVEQERKGWYSVNDVEVDESMIVLAAWNRAKEK